MRGLIISFGVILLAWAMTLVPLSVFGNWSALFVAFLIGRWTAPGWVSIRTII